VQKTINGVRAEFYRFNILKIEPKPKLAMAQLVPLSDDETGDLPF
jgi:hypothetical protein